MQYFKMSPLRDDTCAELDDPVDKAGNSIYSGKPLDCVGRLTAGLVFPDSTRFVDFMSTMTGQLLVSARAARVIRGFRLQDGWQSLDCSIIDDDGRPILDAVCFHFPQFLDVVDESKSEFRPVAKTGRGTIVRAVLDASLLGKFDLFKAAHISGYVCSEALLNALHTARLTGFVFDKLDVA